jgi:hypothetical protein
MPKQEEKVGRQRLEQEAAAKPVVRLMLDSGAYTAWTKKVSIDLDEYIAFIKEHQDLLFCYVNLDVIPGEPGKKRTQDDIEDSAAKSYKNLQYMKSYGLKPVPVFHQGERFYWLKRMIDDGDSYIGISPMADLPMATVRPWLDKVFTLITTRDGKPIIDTHGFGVTSLDLLFRYPWTSCDSTSWALSAGFGNILVPRLTNQKFDYTKTPEIIKVSDAESKGADKAYDNLGPLYQGFVRRFLEEEVGVTIADARYDYGARQKANICYFMKAAAAHNDVRFNYRLAGATF